MSAYTVFRIRKGIKMLKRHTFHIPVMGIGFTIDTPIKVAHLGINSVISLVDDMLIERMRKFYSEKFELPYQKITEKEEDFRAKRITSYLNMMKSAVERNFLELKTKGLERKKEFEDYLQLFPSCETVKKEIDKLFSKNISLPEWKAWCKENLPLGSIDVNIMTKVDKTNFKKGEKLPVEYNDAHAALRGFAKSDLESSVVLSAGMNPRLYSYIAKFKDFYANANGFIKKKIILKISDYRSALIQGKFFAKHGIWISEYRIESGLNCGGHAFASDGNLLGTVLEEFKNKRRELENSLLNIYNKTLQNKGQVPQTPPQLQITVQGGVGTEEEHNFLLDYYNLDSVGWGTPFLLVPEATSVDQETFKQLQKAKEEDLYLSDISPLGVPFNNLRGNSKDEEKQALISNGTPGSPCPKKYVKLNYEYTEKGLCTASARFQKIKIEELKEQNLSDEEYKRAYDKITTKSCVCVGLGTSVLKEKGLDTRFEGAGVSVCPGPNMAYFSKKMSLKDICNHIYGRSEQELVRKDRPQMFLKELSLYIDFLKKKIKEHHTTPSEKQEKYLMQFANNIEEGITYYQNLFSEIKQQFSSKKEEILEELNNCKIQVQRLFYQEVLA